MHKTNEQQKIIAYLQQEDISKTDSTLGKLMRNISMLSDRNLHRLFYISEGLLKSQKNYGEITESGMEVAGL